MQTLSPRRELLVLLTLAGVQFTHIVEFMMVMPLGPYFSDLFHISDQQFGVLVSAYTLAAAFSGLLATVYIDRFERKKMLLILYVLFAAAAIGCGLASSYGHLLVARAASGFFGGILSAMVQTIIGQVIPYARRGKAMGIVMSSFSAATVLGVPTGLFLANHLGWHFPFFAVAGLSLFFTALAWFSLPSIPQERHESKSTNVFFNLSQVLKDGRYRLGLFFAALMMFVGFTVIPYITLYMQSNVGLALSDVPYVYLVGGIATLISTRWIGVLADRFGKQTVFICLSLGAMFPLLLLTNLPALTLAWILPVTTIFFVVVSGRTIPGMALLTAMPKPEVRGTFMTLTAASQSLAMGAAAWVGGLLIHRDNMGIITGFWKTGLVGVGASLITIYLVRRLVLNEGVLNKT